MISATNLKPTKPFVKAGQATETVNLHALITCPFSQRAFCFWRVTMETKIRANYTEHGICDYDILEVDDTGEEKTLGHAYRKINAVEFAAASKMVRLLTQINLNSYMDEFGNTQYDIDADELSGIMRMLERHYASK